MATSTGLQVKADIKKNILYITITGNIRKKYVESVYTDVRFCVADLKPGFHVISDLSKSTIGHLSGIGIFRNIMMYLQENGVDQVIRIIGKHSTLFKQVTQISGSLSNYQVTYCSTMEEALKILEIP